MNSPQLYVVRLTGTQLKGESTCCSGEQLRELLHQLKSWVNDCVWHVSDVKTNNSVESLVSGELQKQRLSTDFLNELCSQVDQFLSGIFLAVPAKIDMPHLNPGLVTEDEPTVDLGDAILEIRAFDTSYFELYTADNKLAEWLKNFYQAEIECICPSP